MATRTEIAQLHRRLGATFVYVTHDQVEAMTMSDRVAMMMDGQVLLEDRKYSHTSEGVAVTVNVAVLAIDTDTSTVFVADTLSVIVHRAMPVRVSGEPSPVLLNVVLAAVELVIVIPAPPDSQVHA